MENKDQLNQNPEENNAQLQEANSKSEVNTDNSTKTSEEVKPEEIKDKPKTKKETDVSDPKNTASSTTAEEDKVVEEKAIAEIPTAEPTEDASKDQSANKDTVKDNGASAETADSPIVDKEAEKSENENEKEEQELKPETDKAIEEVVSEDKSTIEDKKAEESEEKQESHDEDADHDDEEDEDHDEHEEVEEEPKIDYNTLSREELVNILEEKVASDNINEIKKDVALIKVAFLRKNKEEQDKKLEEIAEDSEEKTKEESLIDDITHKFNGAFRIYKEKRKAFLEELEKTKQKNLEAKKIILEELKAMIDSEESLKKTYDEFKVLQDKWKEIGMVPKNEVNNLWQNYHFYVEKFFDKVKINKELRDLDLKKNLETKITLCEKVEELLLEPSILKSFKQLQKYHQEYKETGPVPQDKKDEVWERFKTATDKINERRKEHYDKLQETQKNNFVAKTALCEKAEELLQIENTSIKEWQANTEKITELLKVWKTLGPAPRKQNDEIWERFKGSLDSFFTAKKEFFQNIKDEQLNNYNLKLGLCTQAEALKTSTDWRKTTQDLINLQKEWKKIGPVPRKHSDKIWKRFRAACDEFFNAKSDFYANIGKHETENQELKEELIKKISEYKFEDNKNENLKVLKDFQRQWMEIGHVPIKEKDRLQDEFRNAINKHYDKLNIDKAEVQTINYKQRMESLKDNPNSKRIISNERNFLQNKMKKLEEEINLWENNIGFLAASQKANLLKEEFEKKINAGKDELKVLKEKLKFLEREAR